MTEVVGIGNVILATYTSCKLVLKDVSHISDIRWTIIFACKIDDEGFSNYFGEER